MADIKTRLKSIETKLKEAGIVDVKFAWGDLEHKSFEEIAEDVILALEAMLEGRTKRFEGLGDSPDNN